jgi:uncharacterized protein (TIGR02246 family)
MVKTTAEIADILALQDLAHQYAHNVDRRNAEALAALFTEDCLLDGSGYLAKGREAIAAIPPMLDRRYLKTFHQVSNHRIDVNGDEATGEVYAVSHHLRKEADDSLTDYVMMMRYHDRYVRQGGAWRFAHRQIHMDWTETRPAALPVVRAPKA